MIKDNIDLVLSNIAKAARKSGRSPDEIKLVAVSKSFGTDSILEAYQCGITDFGENRANEFRQKSTEINLPLFWHFVGQLQTNKVKYIINNVGLIHSLDRAALAEELDKQRAKANRQIDVLVQISADGKKGRGGVAENEAERLIDYCRGLSNLRIKGLMLVAPPGLAEPELRCCFRSVRKLYERLGRNNDEKVSMKILSMGMSQDYTLAVEEGSNLVRIGSAIFGTRSLH